MGVYAAVSHLNRPPLGPVGDCAYFDPRVGLSAAQCRSNSFGIIPSCEHEPGGETRITPHLTPVTKGAARGDRTAPMFSREGAQPK
jgi:hypothetical protein